MFVGRKTELESLNKAYRKSSFQFPVIYGRRRVGKTELIKEFIKDKKAIYFVAIQGTLQENLELLSKEILSILAPNAPQNSFQTFIEAMEYVFSAAKNERIVLCIDEYPYLVETDRSISSIIQNLIDAHQEQNQLFFILCGSSMSFMEEQVLGYKSPLYGRRTGQYKILPLDYLTASQMIPGYSNQDKILLYSVTGGIPEYLKRIDTNLTVQENIQDLFFDPSGRLFEEPHNLLKQELKFPQTYYALITAIADGKSRISEIATKTGIETSQASKMLQTLIGLGIVKKEMPISEKSTNKKTIYLLEDLMFVFWFRFVRPNLSKITMGMGNLVLENIWENQFLAHVGMSFEVCSKQYLWEQMRNNSKDFQFQEVGRWWGNNPKEKREEEIDIVAVGENTCYFGECKWRNKNLSLEVFHELEKKSALIANKKEKVYVLFSKSPFSLAILEIQEQRNDLVLVSVDDMFG
ncbi:MAG: ATP-binding protein [Streptococcaceae bacterium]|jgi:AAA+ ATPase superfamily predicted ATPase|nr:ATP-binding protein [Streptococcaceae bacterium]